MFQFSTALVLRHETCCRAPLLFQLRRDVVLSFITAIPIFNRAPVANLDSQMTSRLAGRIYTQSIEVT
jgi:hypothetical protein